MTTQEKSRHDFLLERKKKKERKKEGDFDYLSAEIAREYSIKLSQREEKLKIKMVELFGTTYPFKKNEVSDLLIQFLELEEECGDTLPNIKKVILSKRNWKRVPLILTK